MSSETFQQAVPSVPRREGGFVTDRGDAGGYIERVPDIGDGGDVDGH